MSNNLDKGNLQPLSCDLDRLLDFAKEEKAHLYVGVYNMIKMMQDENPPVAEDLIRGAVEIVLGKVE